MRINLCIGFSQQTGNPCAMGDTEQDHCYTIAQMVYDQLSEHYDDQLNVFIPAKRNGSDSTNLREMVQEANAFFRRNGGDGYYLEIHTDAGGYAKGASGLYVSNAGLVFMRDIVNELTKATPWADVGMVKRTNLHSLNSTIVPAGIVELSFHDNWKEAKWIHDATTVSDVLVRGIVKSLKLKKVNDTNNILKQLRLDIDRITTFMTDNFKQFK
jgi:N-acetylmuramoyl-L-alanine amidase